MRCPRWLACRAEARLVKGPPSPFGLRRGSARNSPSKRPYCAAPMPRPPTEVALASSRPSLDKEVARGGDGLAAHHIRQTFCAVLLALLGLLLRFGFRCFSGSGLISVGHAIHSSRTRGTRTSHSVVSASGIMGAEYQSGGNGERNDDCNCPHENPPNGQNLTQLPSCNRELKATATTPC